MDASAPPFGVVISGRPLLPLSAIDTTKWSQEVPDGQSVTEVTVFLSAPLPDDAALSAYISPPPYSEWMYLGAVANERPSTVLRVRWPPDLVRTSFSAQLLLSLEPLVEVAQKVSPVPPQEEEYQLFAAFIAKDLFRFMESFNKSTDDLRELLVMPTNVIDLWFEKFHSKLKYDPFFWWRKAAGEDS